MGAIGQQSKGALLQIDSGRTKAARVRTRTLVSNHEGNQFRLVGSVIFMPRLRAWFSRLFGLFSKSRYDEEMAEEMRHHIDLLTERKTAAGMSATDARNAALREFGGVEQIKEIAREQRIWRWADEFVQDARFGARMLVRNPGFSILAILCLTLGIGTSAAVMSWIEGILIRPYPLVAHQDRMVALVGTKQGTTEKEGLSYPDFLDLQRHSTLFQSFIVDRIMGTTLSIGDRAERASGGIVSSNYFDALGVRPMLGRGFRPDEGEGRNAHPITVTGCALRPSPSSGLKPRPRIGRTPSASK